MPPTILRRLLSPTLLAILAIPSGAADLVALSPQTWERYLPQGKVAARLASGGSYRFTRRVIPGADLFDVRRIADRLAGKAARPVQLTVKDTAGHPVPEADVLLAQEGKPNFRGRTDEEGR